MMSDEGDTRQNKNKTGQGRQDIQREAIKVL